MNYANINQVDNYIFTVNSKVAGGVAIDWTIKEEGSETAAHTFTAVLTDGAYFQTLTIPVADVTFKKDTFYTLEGISNSDVVYRGKLYATDGVLPASKLSAGVYTENSITNDYIILE